MQAEIIVLQFARVALTLGSYAVFICGLLYDNSKAKVYGGVSSLVMIAINAAWHIFSG